MTKDIERVLLSQEEIQTKVAEIGKQITADFADKMDFACSDVSFISLKHIFPAASLLLKEGAKIAFLIKPQFEAEREQVGKNGIIKDPKVHEEVIAKVCTANGINI